MPYNIPESPFYFAGASIDRDSAEGNRTQALPLCPILRQLSCLLIAQIPCDLPRCVVRAQRPAVVYCRKCQTATATPAEPGDLPIGLGKRSLGGGFAFGPDMWGSVPGGYRNTINDNVVLILMIETLEGLKNADEIAKVPGVHAIFAASSDLGNFAGYKQGDPDYEREINIVHDAAIKAGVKLCGPWAWRDRPDFTCFQAGNEMAAIARGVKMELGEFADTQAKPEIGPFATARTR